MTPDLVATCAAMNPDRVTASPELCEVVDGILSKLTEEERKVLELWATVCARDAATHALLDLDEALLGAGDSAPVWAVIAYDNARQRLGLPLLRTRLGSDS